KTISRRFRANQFNAFPIYRPGVHSPRNHTRGAQPSSGDQEIDRGATSLLLHSRFARLDRRPEAAALPSQAVFLASRSRRSWWTRRDSARNGSRRSRRRRAAAARSARAAIREAEVE